MTITADTFRSQFPEFEDTAKYSDARISFWIGVAYQMLNASILGDSLDFIAMLYVAHNMAIQARNILSADTGIPGAGSGVVSSKSVGPMSVSYDTEKTTLEGAGSYNSTIYGVQFIELIRMFGSNGVQLYGESPMSLSAQSGFST
jgi:hypothetical protein